MGGEVAAAGIVESVARLIPGVLGNPHSIEEESHSAHLAKEFCQYTRPREFEGHQVPEVLVEGHHKRIGEWRKNLATPAVALREKKKGNTR